MNKKFDKAPPILVTGASGGIGQALCRRLCSEGVPVIGVDHNESRLKTLAQELSPNAFEPLCMDLRDEALVLRVEPILEARSELGGLVNLAGISLGNRIEELENSAWESSFQVNATAPMQLSRLAIRFMRDNRGSIVNVGSPVGIIGARKPSYAASKGALHGLTMSLARNLGPRGIRVNLVLPGTCITNMTSDWSEVKIRDVAKGNFLNRLCSPTEVAAVIFFLLGPEASFLTGSVIDMTAGGLWGH